MKYGNNMQFFNNIFILGELQHLKSAVNVPDHNLSWVY